MRDIDNIIFSDAPDDTWHIGRYTEPKYTSDGYLVGVMKPDGNWLGFAYSNFGDLEYTAKLRDVDNNVLFDTAEYMDNRDVVFVCERGFEEGNPSEDCGYFAFKGMLKEKLERLLGFIESDEAEEPETEMPDIF